MLLFTVHLAIQNQGVREVPFTTIEKNRLKLLNFANLRKFLWMYNQEDNTALKMPKFT